ncbi:MAG: nicotinate phosphoribosyltransferase [Chloroflexi bacterium]|nr:nicotinate phosphoribosyltransferase [Chloroflexota bacterium]
MPPNPPPPHPTGDHCKQTENESIATIEFMAEQDGVLCGLAEALALLRTLHPELLQCWTLEQGSTMKCGDVVMRVRGRYRDYGSAENALAGILAVSSGWATAARALAKAAKPAPVVFTGASTVHPALAAQLENAAVTGGCAGSDSALGRGIVPRALILLTGDTLRALQCFDQTTPPEIPRLVYADLFHDPADEAVRVALAVGNRLSGVILHADGASDEQLRAKLERVRAQLDLAGLPRVKIFVHGAITAAQMHEWKIERVPVNGYFAGDLIGAAPPLPFAVEMRECDGKPLARRGQTAGTTPSLRLVRIDFE